MTHKFLAKNSRLPKYPPCPLLRCYERTPADRRVSTAFRRFAIPGPITRLPGFRKAPRFILSLLLSPPPLSFLPSPTSSSFLSTLTEPRSHPFSSVNEPVERKGERVVEQRESKLRPVPGYFLSLPLTRARRFSLPLFLFFSSLPPFPFSFCPPPPPSMSPDFSPQSEKRTETFDSRNQWHYYYYQFTLFIVRDNEEQREGEGGSDIYYIRKIGNWSREFDE